MNTKVLLNTGWVCSICHKSFSPDVQECFYCNADTIMETYFPEPDRNIGPHQSPHSAVVSP